MPMPPQVHVFVRDWLSGNNVLLRSGDGHVLVDSGYSTHAPLTLALVARVLERAPLSRLVNTHGHSDHVGGNAAVKQAYGCPIAFPAAEADLVEQWDTKSGASQPEEPPIQLMFRDYRRVGGLLLSARREVKGKNQVIRFDDLVVLPQAPKNAFD